jgi:hypothetical protein
VKGLPDHDPLAAGLEAAGGRSAELQRQLSEARVALRREILAALASGASYRWTASRAGITLGAVQRLAGGEPTKAFRRAPSPEGGEEIGSGEEPITTQREALLPVCVRGGCDRPVVRGRFCERHLWS